MKDLVVGLCLAAAVGVAVMLPTAEPKQTALSHVERVHVVEPGETVFDVARQYFKEQRQYDSIERYIFAVRMANGGLQRAFKTGDRIIIPLTIPAPAAK